MTDAAIAAIYRYPVKGPSLQYGVGTEVADAGDIVPGDAIALLEGE